MTARLSNVALDYELDPAVETVDHNGSPVRLDTLVVRHWAEGDDGKPYTTVDFGGYRLTKAGARKGGHGNVYLGLNAEQPLLDDLGIEAQVS